MSVRASKIGTADIERWDRKEKSELFIEGWALIEGEAKRLGRLQSVLMDRVEDHHHLQ